MNFVLLIPIHLIIYFKGGDEYGLRFVYLNLMILLWNQQTQEKAVCSLRFKVWQEVE
jgi:hypothetical protein